MTGYVETMIQVECNANKLNSEDPFTFLTSVMKRDVVEKGVVEDEHEEEEEVVCTFSCKKCASRCTWTQSQTRSADEPMTVFLRCTNRACKFEWRV